MYNSTTQLVQTRHCNLSFVESELRCVAYISTILRQASMDVWSLLNQSDNAPHHGARKEKLCNQEKRR
jgi:hypothetical protein